jgi:RND family efflux transporter MFP subunit
MPLLAVPTVPYETPGASTVSTTTSLAAPEPPGKQRRRRLGSAVAVVLALGFGIVAGVAGRDRVVHLLGLHAHGHDGGPPAAAGGKNSLWTCSMHPQVIKDGPSMCPICHMKLEPMEVVKSGQSAMGGGGADDGGDGRKVVYWWDPVAGPASIADRPGKTAGGADLLPVYADELSAGEAVRIDPVVVQNMGVRIAAVSRGPVRRDVRAVGYLEEAQPLVRDVNLRVSGWVETLYADTEGQHLNKGDPLFDLYSPEAQVAVEELVAARKAVAALGPAADELARGTSGSLLDAARRKLELWGLDPAQVDRLSKLEQAPRTITFTSPITGHVTRKSVVAGAAVKAGDMAVQIVDHSTLWLDARVYAQDLPFVRLGQQASATVEGMPGRRFDGEIVFVHPHVDSQTRTATVRMSVPNPELTLRPGMFATAHLSAQAADDAVLVPREAVIDTGVRQVAFVATGGGRFEPRRLKLGVDGSDGSVQVLEGLLPASGW